MLNIHLVILYNIYYSVNPAPCVKHSFANIKKIFDQAKGKTRITVVLKSEVFKFKEIYFHVFGKGQVFFKKS